MTGAMAILDNRRMHRPRAPRFNGSPHRALLCVISVLFVLAGPCYADPDLPRIATNQIFDVTNTTFAGGAFGDGISNNAAAIQAAINTASASIVGTATGGTVRLPANGTLSTYLSGPLTMKNFVNLQVDPGVMLQMLPKSTWPSSGTPFIITSANNLHDMEISGTGTIDGQYSTWGGVDPRPNFIEFDHASRILIQGVTLQNPPKFHIMVHNNNGNLTIQDITINTPDGTANTDGIDLASTNVLIRHCSISDGDDNIQIGSSSAFARNIIITNCHFGTGHGLSIGSPTQDGVSNLVVVDCWWTNTEYGIKGKTDRSQGGTMQDIHYSNLTMTNVNFPIAFYSHYDTITSPSKTINVTPFAASTDTTATVSSTTPFWRNITISNLTAVGNSGPDGPGNIAGIIWGLPESPISNMTLIGVNILGHTSSGRGTFCIYHARGIKIVDSNLTAPTTGTNTLTLYNAGVTLTNSAANTNVVTFTGLGTPSNSVLSVFNGQAGTTDASVLGANPLLTLASSTLTVSNSMSVGNSSTLNFGIGANATKIAVTGSLTLGGTLNISDAGGFTNATYTLFTYGGALTNNGVTIGSNPNATFTYAVDTNTIGVVKLDVASPFCGVGAAGPISGASSVTASTNGVSYSISSVSGAATYTWTVPSGATIASGQGTTSITVNYSCSAVSGNVTVSPSNGSCSGTSSSFLAVTVANVGAAGSITGAASVNAGTNGVAYSISGVSGATTYTWTVPSGASIAGGQGTTSITVNYGCTAVSGSVQVTPSDANSGCTGTPGSLSVIITGVGAASSITGAALVSAGTNGVSYSISSVSGATAYTWTVPSGASIAGGQGTTSITVNYGCTAVSGNVQVTPSNANSCTGTPGSLSVTITGVGAAGSITGAALVSAGTNGVSYSISSVGGATTYTWTAPSGASVASGQGTTSITLNYSCGAAGGNVQVTPSNANGCSGAFSSLAVTVTSVGAAGNISGLSTVCAGQMGVGYSISSVSGATTYTWTVPSGASVASGQGTTSITVDWGSTAGNVTVTPANANGCTGVGAGLSITVNTAPNVTSSPSPQIVCDGGTAGFFVTATGTSLTYQWRKNGSPVSDGGTINGSITTNLTLTGVGTGDSGASFDCVVSGTCTPPAISGGATLTVNPNPTAFNVTGGGSYCGSNGVAVGLDGSQAGVNYQLLLNNNPTGGPVTGTGNPISFGNQTAVGAYTVAATDATTGCTNAMNGSATVGLTDPFQCWRLQYFGCTNCPQAAATADPDGDGQDNMAEFLSGTDPTNSASALRIISAVRQTADVVITWSTAGGYTNTVQATSGDASGSYATNFSDLSGPIVISGSGDATTNYVDSGGATNGPSRYYRIRLVP